ncbi:hypothetical protein BHE74_00014048 [Ensete ventricosum]|nr:hypothetical protein GW17_00009881 [Ensete ventricosum]RWW77761.1 hypothetical protein BHE74_00014048 [Ensete ventricosum]RZR79096.1 hypothetical protein BHM03_00004697 [Ensete ventricosum]
MCAARSGRHLSGNAKRESIGKLDAANRAEWAAPNRDPVVPYEVHPVPKTRRFCRFFGVSLGSIPFEFEQVDVCGSYFSVLVTVEG